MRNYPVGKELNSPFTYLKPAISVDPDEMLQNVTCIRAFYDY